jgi:hypothetical protein
MLDLTRRQMLNHPLFLIGPHKQRIPFGLQPIRLSGIAANVLIRVYALQGLLLSYPVRSSALSRTESFSFNVYSGQRLIKCKNESKL